MSYRAPLPPVRPGPIPQVHPSQQIPPTERFYPLSLAQTPSTLAQPASGWDTRTLMLLLAAAAVGIWLWQRFFAKKKKVARNEALYLTTEGPLRGLDRARKRMATSAKLLMSEGHEGAAKDLEEIGAMLAEFTRRTREQTLED